MTTDLSGEHKKIRILIVEDENLLRSYATDYLEDNGYEVIQASNGREGIERFRAENPDIIFSDLRMPEINGFEFIALVQKESPETPVIVMSGTGSVNDVRQSQKYGAWDYLMKPLKDVSFLELIIDRVLEKKRLLKQIRSFRDRLERGDETADCNPPPDVSSFGRVLENAGDAVILHDQEGSIMTTNVQAMQLLGYGVEELLAKRIGDIHAASDDDYPKRYIASLKKKKYGVFRSVLKRSDGSTFPAMLNASMFEYHGVPVYLNLFHFCQDHQEN